MVFSAELSVRVPVSVCALSQLGVIMSEPVETVVSIVVVDEVEPEY